MQRVQHPPLPALPDDRDTPAASARRRVCLAAIALAALASPVMSSRAATNPSLARPRSLAPLRARALATGEPVVAMFSRVDCPWCEVLRREQLVHLAREAGTRRVQVVEFDLADARAFSERPGAPAAADGSAWWEAASPAALGRALNIRVTPTVAFFGPSGELTERLVGYPSRDFYGAYLDERIRLAQEALRPGRGAASGARPA